MRRTKRCVHGFIIGENACVRCRLIEEAIARAKAVPFRCAVCGGEHVSKHCMATTAGRRRLMRLQNPGLVEIERRRSILSRTQLDESEHLGRDEGAVCP